MLDWEEWRIPQHELMQRQFLVVDAHDSPFAFRETAICWAKEHGLVGTMAEGETGGKGCVGISVGSLREMLNPVQIGKSCGLQVHFAAVTVLRELIRVSVIVEAYFDRLKGANGVRDAVNGVNRNVMILVGYAAMRFVGGLYRVKLTFKRYADANASNKAYAYHVTRIEVLTGTIGNDLPGTAPNANTSTTNQGKVNLHLTPNILLKGVVDVNGVPFVGGDLMGKRTCSPEIGTRRERSNIRKVKMEIKITKDNFESEVVKADRPVLVDFWATWCGPCMMLGPVLAEIAEERKDVIKVGKVNVDEEPELAAKFGIMSIPAVLLFKNGEVVANSVGYVPKEDLNAFVSANI